MLVQAAPISPSLSCLESIKTCFKGYFKFSGRARRSEFWYFFLLRGIVMTSFAFLSLAFIRFDDDYDYYYPYKGLRIASGFFIYLGFYALLDIALFIPLLAASTRRLHDIGHSGFYNFFMLIPLGGVFLLYLWSIDSQPGANIYGPVTKYNINVNAPLIPGGVQVVQPIIAYPSGQPIAYIPQVVSPQPNAYQGEVQNNQGVQNINQIGEQNTGNINQVPQQINPNEVKTIPVTQPNNYTPIENQDNNLD